MDWNYCCIPPVSGSALTANEPQSTTVLLYVALLVRFGAIFKFSFFFVEFWNRSKAMKGDPRTRANGLPLCRLGARPPHERLLEEWKSERHLASDGAPDSDFSRDAVLRPETASPKLRGRLWCLVFAQSNVAFS